MNVLVLIAHPHLKQSRVNRRWKQELEGVPNVTIHDLYEQYSDESIDIRREQELLLSHERIVFQFPFYWYSTPPLLKKWLDEVFTYGWAYGPGDKALRGKELMLAISVGGPENSYRVGGYNHYTISELTRPLQATANLTGMYFLPHFVLYGAVSAGEETVNRSAADYVQYINTPQARRYRMAP
ncbi:NAD(P)H-dependent oxidoreductase [Paenibacillus alkalitolerans]|uniref:NAD(P)H-dependent oxidoreductase n=1 Tax=Paenibacillus alkalitolerans TaxID=2799335 RepID=UPI0018F6CFD4|nr:NAD(P)H-dependent oxidoreductase [Paenibacillus alkalitolerans]